jgi:toxin ParE1/3/4
MELIIQHRVRLQILEVARWYQNQRTGLGGDFADAVEASLASMARFPLQFPIIHRDARRAIIQGFPSGIYFVVRNGAAVAFAVVHWHRNPKIWQKLIPPSRHRRT